MRVALGGAIYDHRTSRIATSEQPHDGQAKVVVWDDVAGIRLASAVAKRRSMLLFVAPPRRWHCVQWVCS